MDHGQLLARRVTSLQQVSLSNFLVLHTVTEYNLNLYMVPDLNIKRFLFFLAAFDKLDVSG